MPNVAHDLEPRFQDIIDADIVDFYIDTVSDKGYVQTERKYGHHLVAWAPFEDGGQFNTTSYHQNKGKRRQSYVQKDGAVNIGTEEWTGKRIVVLVLDETLED